MTVGILVLLVPGTLAFVGPIAQQYWGNRFAKETTNRELFREHRDLLLNRVFWPLSEAAVNYDIDNWLSQSVGDYSVRVPVEGGGRVPMEYLVQWPYARAHLLADPRTSDLLAEVEKRQEAGRTQKRELDQSTGQVIEAVLKTELGFEFVRSTPQTGWSMWPPPAMWYPDYLVPQLRQRTACGDLEVQPINLNHSTGEPPTPVQRLSMNGQLVAQVVEPLALDRDKFRAVYERVRNEEKLQAAFQAAVARRAEDLVHVGRFVGSVREYAESVEVSEKHLLGSCPGCSHLVPR